MLKVLFLIPYLSVWDFFLNKYINIFLYNYLYIFLQKKQKNIFITTKF